MTINPTGTRRFVVIDIQTTVTSRAQQCPAAAAGTEVITFVSIVVDNGTNVIEINLQNAAEIDLLRQFWQVIRPHDVFFGRNISDRLAFVRRRSWKVGLIPASGIDLRAIYQYSTVETGGQESNSGDSKYHSAGALVCLLGLPGNRPGARKCRGP